MFGKESKSISFFTFYTNITPAIANVIKMRKEELSK